MIPSVRALGFVIASLMLVATGCEDDPTDLDHLKDSGQDAATAGDASSEAGTSDAAADAGGDAATGSDAGSDDAGGDAG